MQSISSAAAIAAFVYVAKCEVRSSTPAFNTFYTVSDSDRSMHVWKCPMKHFQTCLVGAACDARLEVLRWGHRALPDR